MMEGDTHKSVARSATHFLTGTFISRVSGMVRDLSMAYYFGTSPAASAFFIAFRFSNLFRRLFGEGALLNGFIPFFENKRKEDPKQGAEFFRDLFWSLATLLLLIVVAGEGLMLGVLYIEHISPSVKEILYLTMLMLPGVIFICLFGLSMALLECEKSFFLPGVAPVAFNIVWIAAVFYFRHSPPFEAMCGISTALVFAFFLQWWVTLPSIKKYVKQFLTPREWFSAKLFSKDLRNLVAPLFLGVVGVAAVQVNSAIDVIIARHGSDQGPAFLSFAHRLQQLPLALFGIAIAGALLPPLTRAIKRDDPKLFRSLLQFGFARTFTLLLPGTIAIFILGGASVNLLYGRGEFGNYSTIYTTLCLWGYGIGLVPTAFVILLAPAFYARRDYWTPTLGAILSVLINLFLNILFVYGLEWGAPSVAVATSVSAIVNMRFLMKNLHVPFFHKLKEHFGKVTLASLLAGFLTLLFSYFYFETPTLPMLLGNVDVQFTRNFMTQMREFTVLTSLYGVLFLFFSYLMKSEHVLELFSLKRSS